MGACLGAAEVQIWTDVDGVFSADPRRDARARHFEALSFRDAERLARAGAKVLHPETMAPAEAAGIPVRVLNTFNPDGPSTLISDAGGAAAPEGDMPELLWASAPGTSEQAVTA